MRKGELAHAYQDGMVALRACGRDSVPDKLRAAAREIVEEQSTPGLAMRDVARRVGVSAPAAYRYFASREDLLASVAAEGFNELTAELDAAAQTADPLVSLGLAYVDFATSKRGVFALMFGPLLSERTKYPDLDRAATTAFDALERSLAVVDDDPTDVSPAATTARGLVRGLSNIVIESGGRGESAQQAAQGALFGARRPRQRQESSIRVQTPKQRWQLN